MRSDPRSTKIQVLTSFIAACIPMQWQNLQVPIVNPILESLGPLPALPEENPASENEDLPRVDESEQSISAVHSPLQ
jgi:hypothetical protein